MTLERRCGAVLTIDLDALIANHRLLRAKSGGAACAGVLKADAYGLGMDRVGPALAAVGCRTFFVAHIEEGVRLRGILPDADIHVLHGLLPGCEEDLAEHALIPVLGSLGDLDVWRAFVHKRGESLPADVHADTGMSRLGLPPDELAILADEPDRLAGIDTVYVMSHLACADDPDHPLNGGQLESFRRVRDALPMGAASLANSSGIFLGADYHYDLTRPGIAVYGGNPVPGNNPMSCVARLDATILQVRSVRPPETVGYGASHAVSGPARIATLGVGYADGYLRALGNAGSAIVGGHGVPVVGRVSMDLITLDVTGVPEHLARPGGTVQLMGPDIPVDEVAAAAGTISYEILTSLGGRYHRAYVGGG